MAQIIDHPWKTLKQLSIPMWFFDQRDQNIYFNDVLRQDLDVEKHVVDKQDVKGLLHNEDIDTLKENKIDRSFINQIDSDENDVAFVSAIIEMAKSLSLQIIAEGVEREVHIRYLKQKGCYEYQAYFFSNLLKA